ncbi:unnamed protein product [Angiostrongylus costaricensis]|uniref:Uncharacterized protein n=1 Tax=Angiostrongylus costaricensis TaxID=334426 RepID=A0A158PDM7_ANGCS|nr:unnamed protein product [Angiostrongylus costaricensis]
MLRMNINRGMGFSRSKPCIMLRLTRVSYDFLSVNVKGSASLQMIPEEGMSTCAFPFWNQIGYEQPYVMLRISNLTAGMVNILNFTLKLFSESVALLSVASEQLF